MAKISLPTRKIVHGDEGGASAPTHPLHNPRPYKRCDSILVPLLLLTLLPSPQQFRIILSKKDRIVMCWPKHLLVNRDSSFVQRLCISIFPLIEIEVRQIVEPDCQGGMLWP